MTELTDRDLSLRCMQFLTDNATSTAFYITARDRNNDKEPGTNAKHQVDKLANCGIECDAMRMQRALESAVLLFNDRLQRAMAEDTIADLSVRYKITLIQITWTSSLYDKGGAISCKDASETVYVVASNSPLFKIDEFSPEEMSERERYGYPLHRFKIALSDDGMRFAGAHDRLRQDREVLK